MVSRLTGIFRRRDMDPDCKEVREVSSDFLDEELDQASASQVTEHIKGCPPCNSFINTLKATIGLLRATPKQNAPADFKERLKQTIREQQNR